MKKFLFIYNASPEEGKDSSEDWMNWFKSLGEHLQDIGNPIQGGVLVKAGNSTNLSSFSDFVGGYSLISAGDIDQAISLAKSCPNEAGVRVFEALPM